MLRDRHRSNDRIANLYLIPKPPDVPVPHQPLDGPPASTVPRRPRASDHGFGLVGGIAPGLSLINSLKFLVTRTGMAVHSACPHVPRYAQPTGVAATTCQSKPSHLHLLGRSCHHMMATVGSACIDRCQVKPRGPTGRWGQVSRTR